MVSSFASVQFHIMCKFVEYLGGCTKRSKKVLQNWKTIKFPKMLSWIEWMGHIGIRFFILQHFMTSWRSPDYLQWWNSQKSCIQLERFSSWSATREQSDLTWRKLFEPNFSCLFVVFAIFGIGGVLSRDGKLSFASFFSLKDFSRSRTTRLGLHSPLSILGEIHRSLLFYVQI